MLINNSLFNIHKAIQCEYGQVYQECGPLCQESCFDTLKPSCFNQGCSEGCFCPQNEVMDQNGKCVLKTECPCKHNGLIYDNKQIFFKQSCQIWLVKIYKTICIFCALIKIIQFYNTVIDRSLNKVLYIKWM